MHRIATAGWLLCAVSLLAIAPAHAALCLYDSKLDGSGANVRWTTAPIGYYVNVSRLPAAQQAAALAAVQAAFTRWELSCTTLKFQYQGASASTTDVPGAILVYWGNDAASWLYGASAYYYGLQWQSLLGDVTRATIGMNAKDYLWSVGASPQAIDIESAVTQIMPGALGFYAGADPQSGSVAIAFNSINRTLTQEHQGGARYLYFKADPGCTQPPKPKPCATWLPPSDGVPPDAGVMDSGAKDAGIKDAGIKDSAVKDQPPPDHAAAFDTAAQKDAPGLDAGKDVDAAGKDVALKQEGAAGKEASAADTARAEAARDDRSRSEGGRLDRAGSVDGRGWALGGEPPPAAAPPRDEGCSCSTAAAGPASALPLAALLLLALRRRRSRR
jgi:MYXO-CTERM domain-containing protein